MSKVKIYQTASSKAVQIVTGMCCYLEPRTRTQRVVREGMGGRRRWVGRREEWNMMYIWHTVRASLHAWESTVCRVADVLRYQTYYVSVALRVLTKLYKLYKLYKKLTMPSTQGNEPFYFYFSVYTVKITFSVWFLKIWVKKPSKIWM